MTLTTDEWIAVAGVSVTALGLLGSGAWLGATYFVEKFMKAVSFFTRMDEKIDHTHADVKIILHNHLPHIYERLGEKYEIREDTYRYIRGGSVNSLDLGPDINVASPGDGGLTSGVEDSK